MEPQTKQWRNRIVGHGVERPDQILANPKNFRFHPKFQQDALEGVLASVGLVQDVIINRMTGHLIDGHLRVSLAMKRGITALPVKYVDLSEEEENVILATFDPLSALAATDGEKLGDLVRDVQVGPLAQSLTRGVDALLNDLKADAERASYMGEKTEREQADLQSGSIYALNEAPVFSASNKWGIPDYLPEMLSAQIPTRVWDGVEDVEGAREEFLYIYGTSKPPDNGGNRWENGEVVERGGVMAFYTDDHRFEVIWNDAVRIVEKFLGYGWGSIIAPDFSMWGKDPFAIQIYNLYRSRWVARYWQEAGIPVIPTLMWTSPESMQWLADGIPKQAPVVALQVRTAKTQQLRIELTRDLLKLIPMVDPQNVILYGGLENRDWLEGQLPGGPEYHWLTAWTNQRRKKKVIKVNRHGDKAVL
jgi:hypothetical protein